MIDYQLSILRTLRDIRRSLEVQENASARLVAKLESEHHFSNPTPKA